jgi:hypothetical protein
MINGSVFETQISRLRTMQVDILKQVVAYLTRGEPDNHTRRLLRDVEFIENEIKKVLGESAE